MLPSKKRNSIVIKTSKGRLVLPIKNVYSYGTPLFPFRFKFTNSDGVTFKPRRYLNRSTGRYDYNTFSIEETNLMPIGYCLFKRDENGILWALTEESFAMGWSRNRASVWNSPHEKIEKGQFIVKTTRQYPDIKFLGGLTNKSNYRWKQI